MDNIKGVLERLEEELNRLRLQYDLFFQGMRKTEPSEERRILEETIRKMGQRKIINTYDQFRFNALQSRFYSMTNLWTRMVRDYEEGRMERDATGALVQAAPRAESIDTEALAKVIEELAEARRACGMTVEPADLETMRDALARRAREISEGAGGKKVAFRVAIEDGKPKIKAVLQ